MSITLTFKLNLTLNLCCKLLTKGNVFMHAQVKQWKRAQDKEKLLIRFEKYSFLKLALFYHHPLGPQIVFVPRCCFVCNRGKDRTDVIRYISFVLCFSFLCYIEQFNGKSLDQNEGNSCYFPALDRFKKMFSVLHGRSWKLEVKAVNSLWIRGQKPVIQKVVLKIIFKTKLIKYHLEYGLVKTERYYSVSELSLISFL